MRFCTTGGSDQADAWLALALVPGLPSRIARRLAEQEGGPGGALGLAGARLEALGFPAEVRAAWREARTRAADERRALAQAGARLVCWTDPEYPARLRAIADPPLVLAVRGGLDAPDVPAVAIVGARRASPYGRRIAEELATGLAQAGVTVVSGLAAGIDSAAHAGALGGHGRTVAVLATGIDQVYPRWNAPLAARVVEAGALLSEFSCGTPPLRHHFPRRNRIVAGLAVATVVVEAAARSGSLITARCALDEGREVFAVPGPLGVPLHEGPHALIREGAVLVRSADDVLDAIAPTLRPRLAAARVEAARAGLTEAEARVLRAVAEDGHVDGVIRRTGLAAAVALETLLALELRGVLAQEPGMRFRPRAA